MHKDPEKGKAGFKHNMKHTSCSSNQQNKIQREADIKGKWHKTQSRK